MRECGHCFGEGENEIQEDGHYFFERCLPCGGSGQLDEQAMREDDLSSIASWLAWGEATEYRKAANEDPEGEGWAFAAAENMMTEYEYTQDVYYSKFYRFMQQIGELSGEQQDVLIAWNDYNKKEKFSNENRMDSRRESYSESDEGQEAIHQQEWDLG